MELELSSSVIEQLTERAKTLGIRPEELARAAVADLVARPAEDQMRSVILFGVP